MDKLTRYREIIRRELQDFAEWSTKPDSPIRSEVVHDPVLEHFELIQVGFEGRRRIHSMLFHLDIIDGKVWVQYDGTDRPVAEALVRAGIPKEDIVLAEKPADVRPFTGYGVG